MKALLNIKQNEYTSHPQHLSTQIWQVWLKHCHVASSFPPPPLTMPPIPHDHPNNEHPPRNEDADDTWRHTTSVVTNHPQPPQERHQSTTSPAPSMHTWLMAGEDDGDGVVPSPGKQAQRPSHPPFDTHQVQHGNQMMDNDGCHHPLYSFMTPNNTTLPACNYTMNRHQDQPPPPTNGPPPPHLTNGKTTHKRT